MPHPSYQRLSTESEPRPKPTESKSGMAWSTTLRTCFVAGVSSLLTLMTVLLLIRPGYDNIVTTVVDRLRSLSKPPNECPAAPSHMSSQEGMIPTTFIKNPWQNPFYGGKLGAATKDEYWDSLLTPNGGFLVVDIPDQRNHVGVSMFHQLHCLSMFRSVIVSGKIHKHHLAKTGDSSEAEYYEHLLHCFDYVIQAMLCQADDTLEIPVASIDDSGNEEDKIDGMGQTHQCRNATHLYDYVSRSEKTPVSVASLGKYSVFP